MSLLDFRKSFRLPKHVVLTAAISEKNSEPEALSQKEPDSSLVKSAKIKMLSEMAEKKQESAQGISHSEANLLQNQSNGQNEKKEASLQEEKQQENDQENKISKKQSSSSSSKSKSQSSSSSSSSSLGIIEEVEELQIRPHINAFRRNTISLNREAFLSQREKYLQEDQQFAVQRRQTGSFSMRTNQFHEFRTKFGFASPVNSKQILFPFQFNKKHQINKQQSLKFKRKRTSMKESFTKLQYDSLQNQDHFSLESILEQESPMKVSVYKQMAFHIFHAINFIKQIKKMPELEAEQIVNFAFKKANFKKLLIFDLDETLIHCQRDVQVDEGQEGNFEPEIWLDIESPEGENVKIGFTIRPFAVECLKYASQFYEIAIFTAGFDWYANPIIDYLDPKGELISHRFFRNNCTYLEDEEMFIKDLRIFKGIDLENMLIVDNFVYSFAFHLENGIPIVPYFGNKDDKEMIRLIKYIQVIKDKNALRQINKDIFKLRMIYQANLESFIKYYSFDALDDTSMDSESCIDGDGDDEEEEDEEVNENIDSEIKEEDTEEEHNKTPNCQLMEEQKLIPQYMPQLMSPLTPSPQQQDEKPIGCMSQYSEGTKNFNYSQYNDDDLDKRISRRQSVVTQYKFEESNLDERTEIYDCVEELEDNINDQNFEKDSNSFLVKPNSTLDLFHKTIISEQISLTRGRESVKVQDQQMLQQNSKMRSSFAQNLEEIPKMISAPKRYKLTIQKSNEYISDNKKSRDNSTNQKQSSVSKKTEEFLNNWQHAYNKVCLNKRGSLLLFKEKSQFIRKH